MRIHQPSSFMHDVRPRPAFAALALALLLSACGGGGGAGTNAGVGAGAGGSGGSTGPAGPQAPTISSQPIPLAVTAGSAATLSTTASGTDLSYQWQRDGVNIAGATASTYTLTAVQLSDDGSRWSVVLTAAGMSLTSTAATLSVKPPTGLSLVAGALGGIGNADGPVGRFHLPGAMAINAAGVVHLDQAGRVRTLTTSSSGEYVAGTKPWPLPYDLGYMVTDPRVRASLNQYRAMAFDAAGNFLACTAII